MDYSGIYYQPKNGKVFEIRQKSDINAYNDCELIPINFSEKSKKCGTFLVGSWLRRGVIKPYNPLQPSRRVKQLDFKPMSSKIIELLENNHLDEF